MFSFVTALFVIVQINKLLIKGVIVKSKCQGQGK